MFINNILKSKSLLVDELIILTLTFSLALNYGISDIFGYLDELVITYMIVIIILNYKLLNKSDIRLLIISVIIILYSLALNIANSLPVSSYVQIVISLKFLVVFYYYYIMPVSRKIRLVSSFLGVFQLVIFLTFPLLVLEFFIIPELYTDVMQIYRDGRGINGLNLTSIFHSRSFFASYLLVHLVLILNLKKVYFPKISRKYWLSVIIVAFILLSTSRKELALAFIFISLSMTNFKSLINRLFFSCVATLVMAALLVSFYFLYQDVNVATLGNTEYVRFKIFSYGLEIAESFFPFGSGLGTYGSSMSMHYDVIYDKFMVPEAITGYDGQVGPIYDMYLASLIAEYGLGSMLFLASIVRICNLPGIESRFYVRRFSLMSSFLVCFLLLLTPILTNNIGFYIFSLLGLVKVYDKDVN